MKKIFIKFAFVFMLVSCAYADGEPAHIVLGNVINLTGGNDYVYIQTDDYSVSDTSAASSITVLDYEWSAQPVMFGSIPSGRNALLNPDEPVDIITKGEDLSLITWGGEGVYSVRILDSNGNAILKDTLRTRSDKPVMIKLTPEYRHYYIEFAQTELDYDYNPDLGYVPSVDSSQGNITYCYVLLRMKGTKAEPKREPAHSEPEKYDPEKKETGKRTSAASEVIDDIYRTLRRKTDNDSVINENNMQEETRRHDDVFRPSEPKLPEEKVSQDEDTTLIPARRIRIKRSTGYDSESESEQESEHEAEHESEQEL